jgi:fermentation-respiration switch protein FrsA (DUF1100 family)
MREDIEFDADGTTLRGWFYMPHNASEQVPVIIVTHGYGGVKEQYLDRYAEVFAAAGLAVLVYDHRNFGASDGLPRQEVDPLWQVRDYRSAITYAQTRSEINVKKIGIWGSSYSGGHVLVVGAIDKRVGAVVSQAGTISGYLSGLRRMPSSQAKALRTACDADRAARARGEVPAMIPMASEDPTKSGYGDDTRDFLFATRDFAPSWRNEITLRSIEMSREYEPGIYISRISPTPLLMILATGDDITPIDLSLDAYNRALEPKELLLIEGGHYTPYVVEFEQGAAAARDFYVKCLLGNQGS